MVQEVRRIMLTPEELVSAFESYRRMTPGFLPEGRIVSCIPLGDGAIKVLLKMPENTLPTKSEFVFKDMDAVNPLIRFCIENNIMLPRSGQKSLFIKDGTASLYVVLNLNIDLAGYLSPMRVDQTKAVSPGDIVRHKGGVGVE